MEKFLGKFKFVCLNLVNRDNIWFNVVRIRTCSKLFGHCDQLIVGCVSRVRYVNFAEDLNIETSRNFQRYIIFNE